MASCFITGSNSILFRMEMSCQGVCNFLDSVSLKQKFEVTDQHYSPRTDQRYSFQMDQCYSSVLQISFIQKVKESTFSRHEGMMTQKMRREERPWPNFGSSFYVFSPPPGPALCKLGQPGVLFVFPEVLTPVLGPSFVQFSRAFPFLAFQPPPFWTPFLTT